MTQQNTTTNTKRSYASTSEDNPLTTPGKFKQSLGKAILSDLPKDLGRRRRRRLVLNPFLRVSHFAIWRFRVSPDPENRFFFPVKYVRLP